MKNRTFGEIGILLVLSTVLIAVSYIQPANALGTISILSDGSVIPSNAPIQRNGNLYTLTSNTFISGDGIDVWKDNILIDGAGHYIQGSTGSGVYLQGRYNVTIQNMGIMGFNEGIWLAWDSTSESGSTQNSIIGNNITNNNHGVYLYRSSNNTIAGNTITGNAQRGIVLVDGSNANLIFQNNIKNNAAGIFDDSVRPQTGCSFNNVTANLIAGNGAGALNGAGISLNGGGNSISYNDIVQNSGDGISFGFLGNTVFKNHIENNGGDGIIFHGSSYSNVTYNDIVDNTNGILFDAYWYYADIVPSDNFVSGNNIIGNHGDGVTFVGSQNSTISRNNIKGNSANGIYFDRYTDISNNYIYCSNNTVYENTLEQNLGCGIRQAEPLTEHGGYPLTDNKYYHNNFISNQAGPAYTPYWEESVDSWDNGYPSGGNYYNDFANQDIYSGANQNLAGRDGIWDQMRMFDEGTWDHYPLVYPWSTGLILFADGFEAGNLGAWSGTTVTTGETVAVSTTPFHHGSYSGRFASNGGEESEKAYCFENITSSNELYVRGYVYVSQSGITGNDNRFNFIVLRAGDTPVAYAGWRMTSGALEWSIIIRDGNNLAWPTAYSTGTPALNRWYCVEFHWKQGTTSGLGELWVDGTSVCSITGKNTDLQGSVNLVCFGLADVYHCVSTVTYCDCIATSTSYIGQESSQAYLVVRGNDNGLYYRAYGASAWTGWTSLPGSTCDSPTAALYNDGLHIVVRGMDGSTLWHGYVNLTDNTFSGWTQLSGSTPSAPTLTSNGTALCLVVRGGDNRIYYRCYSGSWGSWHAVPTGATSDAPAAAMLGNDLHIVVRGMDGNSLWDTIVSCDGTVVRGWRALSGATPSKPVLACSGADNLRLIVRGMDNRIYRRSYTGSADSWADWNALPTGTTIDSPAATVMGNRLWTVVRGSDGKTLWCGDIDFGTNSFTGWSLLSGATPSAPTLTS